MTTLYVYNLQPYGAGKDNPNHGIYWERAEKAQWDGAKSGEPCCICGRRVNTLKAKRCIVDVEDATFTARVKRTDGRADPFMDLRWSYVGSDCHAKHVIGSFESED